VQGQPGNFPYGKDLKSYNYGEVVTPYQKLQKDFDGPIGKHLQEARLWRIGFVFSSIFSSLLLLILIAIMNSTPFSIFAVGITDKGFTSSANFLNETYTIPDYAYSGFINKTFLSADKNTSASNLWVNSFLSDEAKIIIRRFLELNMPEDGKFKISDIRLAKNNMLTFTMELYNATGISNIFILNSDIVNKTPQDVVLIKLNPLGFYMEDLIFRPVLSENFTLNPGKEDGTK